MRIAREALMREVVRYGGQSAVVLALLGAIGYAGYWSLSEMRDLPAFLHKIAQPFMPPAVTPSEHSATPGNKVAEKAVVKMPVRKHHPRPRTMQIAAKVSRKPAYATSDDPHGGHIIYQDGMITQYSWDK